MSRTRMLLCLAALFALTLLAPELSKAQSPRRGPISSLCVYLVCDGIAGPIVCGTPLQVRRLECQYCGTC